MSQPTISTQTPREFAQWVVEQLRGAGFEAYWAGGCVRDLVLGKPPKDYDVATNARPEQVQQLFRRTRAIGASFGVIQVQGARGVEVEVATFRSDGTYSDGRHPDSVHFSSAREDALRRDFTINGMFFDPISEQITDFVGGQDDLRARVIRAIGDPDQRFAEDKLRMLRAIRFASTLQFALEPRTANSIRHMADQLNVVSAERVLVELRSMLTSPHRLGAMRLLEDCQLLPRIDGDLAQSLEATGNREKVHAILSYWKGAVSFPLVMAGLLCAVDSTRVEQFAEELMRRLRASNEERERLLFLCQHRGSFRNADKQRASPIKRLFVHPGAEELLELTEAIEWQESGTTSDSRYCRNLLQQWSPEEIDPPPVLTGQDLIQWGLDPGPSFKRILDSVRDAQLDGFVNSREEALALLTRFKVKGPVPDA